MSKPITWEPKKVKVADLKENPDNPKLLNEKGQKRLHKLLGKYGLAGTLIVNTDYTIIDGHSRKKELEEKGIAEVYVSMPSRKLSKKEYDEMNAVFDLAKAGDPDTMMMEETFGDEFMEEWELKSSINDDNEPEEPSGYDSSLQWFLNIRCESEQQCQQLYEKFIKQGLDVKIVT